MICPSCAHENRPGAKFCEECAGALPRACASCGAELRPTAKFCDECATPTGVAPSGARGAQGTGGAARSSAPADTRKVVTIIFGDLVGSTALHERLDAESVRQFMESYYAAMRGAVEAHGGRVTQVMGDGVKAVFGAPRVAEDDAIRAVRAGVEMQQAFRALAEQQRGRVGTTGLRVAVNTGEVVANDDAEIIGDPVNVAARLQEQGKDGDVVVGESTHRLVSTLLTLELLGSFALKGRSEAVKAYRVVSLDRPAGAATAPFVGRDEELARLTAVYATAVEKPAAGLAVLVGSPGLGKSRLIDEFARRHASAATVVRASCDAAGAATFAPLAQALRGLLGIEDGASAESLRATLEGALSAEEADRARIAGGIAALLAGSPASPEETFFVVRRMLGALARAKPVVLVIDDLHWAEPLLLDLVEHLIQWGGGVRLLVLIGARPELRDLRSSLVTPGGLVADVVTLSGLDAGAAMRLAANVIGASDLPAAIAAKVLATSEGNPLFVGELVRMLVQEGALTKDGDRWIAGANLAALEMPPTIHALLAARIERLRPEERTVLERAAVVGRHFSRNAVAALLPNAGDLDARLEALRRSELIERDTGWLLGEPVLRFHHVLIRDAAYRRLLKGTRSELHAKLADWIEAQVGDAPEHDETIGWHLEQAHAFLRELGPLDANGKRLGERAAKRLAAAGRRALAGDDVPLAASLLGRAIERLDAEDPARADLALDWCEALLSAGDVVPAAAALAELGRFAASDDRLRAWQTCFASQLTVLTAPQGLQAAADAVAAAAQQLTAQGDAAGEAKAYSVHAQALARLGRVGACEAALDLALAAARRAGDRRRANAVLAGAPLAALWGPSPVTRASGRCLDVVRVLRITQGAPAVESVALSCQGVLEALRGRTEAARRMLAAARRMVEELGIASRLFEADVFAGRIEAMEGDTAAAERLLRGAYEGLRDVGLGIDAARAGALLARVLLAQDRGAEAEVLTHESEALAGDDLQAAIAWRGVRAEALAKRGEHEAATSLAQAAVAIASATDALLDHADARMALAAALRAAGRAAEADAEERRALELWETKGATLLAERARGDGGRAAPATVAAEEPGAAPPAARRRVRPNAATALLGRINAAIAARDFDAFAARFREDFEEFHHPTGSTFGKEASIASLQHLFRSREAYCDEQPLVTLGESLVLFRRGTGAAGASGHRYDVGAYENETISITEVDERGLVRRSETFASDRLADAIACLYERHADLLPEGPERERAAAAARSFGFHLLAPGDEERAAEVLAPDFESIDHRPLRTWSARGSAAFLDHLRALRAVAADVAIPTIDVLALEPDAVLTRRMHSGTDRVGGGEYERAFLVLFATDAAGRLARAEWFDTDREAEALARFDALTAPVAKPAATRRVRANAATAIDDRFVAAIAERDLEAARACFDPSFTEIDHSIGSQHGHDPATAGLAYVFRARDLVLENERLATFGASLLLARRHYRGSSFSDWDFETADWCHVQIALEEAGDQGRFVRAEIFAPDRLGEAVARLYERYAEGLGEGPARERATTAARVVRAGVAGLVGVESVAEVASSDIEVVDHRRFGLWSARGGDAFAQQLCALSEVTDDVTYAVRDILAAEPNAFVLGMMDAGTDRRGGGAYERIYLSLGVIGTDGRLTRLEFFEADREAEALARFDALVADAEPKRGAQRRVRANAATRAFERFGRTLAARDRDALAQHFDTSLQVVHHPTRATYGQHGMLGTWRSTLKAERFAFRQELLASLGDTLALDHHVVSVAGLAESHVAAFGASEFDEISLLEVDDSGLWLRSEIFAVERLGDALVRLYERYAAQQPEGPARTRATVAAQAVATAAGPIVLDRRALAYAPDLRVVDHRVFATWSSESAAELLDQFRRQLELAPDQTARIDGVLGIEPDGLLLRTAYFGTAVDSGGAFENRRCEIVRFGDDGRISQVELFEAEQEAEALARFEALFGGAAAEPAPDPFDNAASRADRRLFERFNARDWPGIEALAAPDLVFDERRRMLRNSCGRDVWLEQFRMLFDVPASRFTTKLRATRGERLALSLHRFQGEVAGGGGPLAMDDHLVLHEVDRDGRIVAIVLFDLEDEDAAYAELDARFDAGEGAAHVRTLAAWRRFEHAMATRDWDALGARSPGFVFRDHRLLGWGTTMSDAASAAQITKVLVELAPDVQRRHDHVRLCERGILEHLTWVGTRDGGAFENACLAVYEWDAQGRRLAVDNYDVDRFDLARARFAELAAPAEPTPQRFENAASRAWRAVNEAWSARDLDRFEALHAAFQRYLDHRRLFQLDLDRAGFLDFTHPLLRMRAGDAALDLVATRGERLALMHSVMQMEDETVGPSTIESLMMIEVNEHGAITAYERWDLEDEDAAYTELVARWEAGEGAEHPAVLAFGRNFSAAFARHDWDALAACFAPDFVGEDHRLVSWGTLRGPAIAAAFRTMAELAPDARLRYDHSRVSGRTQIAEGIWMGTRDGGAFESPFILVSVVDARGKGVRTDFYDPRHLDLALARFEELRASEPHDPLAANVTPNLATAAMARNWAVFDVLDLDAAQEALDAARAQYAPDFVWDDRRPIVGLSGDLELMVASVRERLASGARQERRTIVGTAGDRVGIGRVLWAGGPADGRFEVEFLVVSEVNQAGLFTALVFFEPGETRAAQCEAWARWAAIDPVAAPWVTLLSEITDGWNAQDRAKLGARFAADVVVVDHRHTGVGRIEGSDAYVDANAVLWELAPDQRIEFGHCCAIAPHGAVFVLRRTGTIEGGGAFENEYAWLALARDGRITRLELFELEDLDRALERFEALRVFPPSGA